MSRATCLFLLILCIPSLAYAQSTPPDILWHRALLLQARGDPGAGDMMAQACEAGAAPACLDAAADSLEAGDLDMAEEYLHLGHDADANDENLRLALARMMASRGNYMWAVREFQALEHAGHNVDFELGYCLYQLGLHEQAAASLSEVAPIDGDRDELAALYGAAAREQLGQFDEARLLAEQAEDIAGRPDVAEAARAMRQALRRQGTSDRVLFSGYATVSGGYDSNPVVAPDEAPSREGGGRLWFRGGMFGEPLGGDAWAIGGRVNLSRDQSFNEAARPFDFTALQAAAHARFNYRLGIPNEFRLGYRYNIGWLDGGQGVEEDDIYAYSEGHRGELIYSLAPTDRLTTRIRASSGWDVYHNMARTGVPLSVGVGQSAIFLDGHMKLYGEVGMRGAWTRSPQYDRAGFSLGIALSYLTPLWDLELVASYAYQWSLYYHSESVQFAFDYTQPDLRRRDSVNNLIIEIGRNTLEDHLRIALRYRLTLAASTIATYDYSRHIVELAVTSGGSI